MALREQQASCTRQKWHRRALSEPNLKLAKPERAPVLSSPVVPGVTDTDEIPGKSLFAAGSSAGQAMQQPPGEGRGEQHEPFLSVCSWHCPAD